MKDRILQAADSPRDLEALYRSDPGEFVRGFSEAWMVRPDSQILSVWRERLFFGEPAAKVPAWRAGDLWLTVALVFVAGTFAELPRFFPMWDQELFYSRNLAAIVAGALTVFFCIQRKCGRWVMASLAAAFAGVVVFLNILPCDTNSQTGVLACLHAPVLFWSVLGAAFLGGAWRDVAGRMVYIRYNGELLIFTTIILAGGVVLTLLTLSLFQLIDVNINEWYGKYVVVYGSIGAPIVATLLIDRIIGERFKIAPLLAKVFTPLFLVTVVVYLAAMIAARKSPFTDRDFLIAFNVLLVVVLGLCVFSISERGREPTAGFADFMNAGLVAVTLLVDLIALAAILFRLSAFGFTPNRLVVLGANVLIFVHLAGILFHYVRFLARRDAVGTLESWIVRYLPAYAVWSGIVVVGFPLVFRFR